MDKRKKFLTVFAVFDDKTQKELKALQNSILAKGFKGTQTMDIPFHLSLGSFPVCEQKELENRIKRVCSEFKSFSIDLLKVNHFANKVLFIEPDINKQLIELHELFQGNFADGFDWHPHATIFCDVEENVIKAKEILSKKFKTFSAKIVGIDMGEFFPTKMIIKEELINQ